MGTVRGWVSEDPRFACALDSASTSFNRSVNVVLLGVSLEHRRNPFSDYARDSERARHRFNHVNLPQKES